MPDRYGDEPANDIPDDLWAEETRRITAATEAHIAQLEAQEAAAIQATCPLCDDDGTTPEGFPCDHRDLRPAAQRGMAAIRAKMGWDDESHADTPKNPPTGRTAPGNGIQTSARTPDNDTNGHALPTHQPAPHQEKI